VRRGIQAELARRGRNHGRKQVARLMRRAAVRVDAIRRDFTADTSAVNRRWCGDITHIASWEGWLYLLRP
jgi:transposase InsO family protein